MGGPGSGRKKVVTYRAELDNNGVKKGLKEVDQGFANTGKKGSKNMGILGDSIGGVTGKISENIKNSLKLKIALAAILAITAKLTAEYIKFGREISNVNTLLGVSKNKLKAYRKQLNGISNDTGKSSIELAKGMYDVISAGIKGEESLKALTLATEASVAGQTQINTAAQAGIAIMNAFGKSVEDLSYIYDVQFSTVKNGIVTYEELASNQDAMLTSAVKNNIELETMYGAFAHLTTNGLGAAEAAEALGSSFDDLVDKRENIEAIGVEIFDQNGNMRNYADIVTDLSKKFEGLTEEQASMKLASLGFTDTAMSAFAILLKDADSFNEALNKTSDSAGAASKAYKTATDNIGSDLDKLGAKMKNTGMNIVAYFEEPIRKTIAVLSNIWDKVFNISAVSEVKKNIQEQQVETAILAKRYEELSKKQNLSNVEEKLRVDTFSRLKEMYPDHFKNLDDEKESYEKVLTVLQDINKEIERKAAIELAQAEVKDKIKDKVKEEQKYLEIEKQNAKLKYNLDEGVKLLEEYKQKYSEAISQGDSSGINEYFVLINEQKEGIEQQLDLIESSNKKLEKQKKKITDIQKEVNAIIESYSISPDLPVVENSTAGTSGTGSSGNAGTGGESSVSEEDYLEKRATLENEYHLQRVNNYNQALLELQKKLEEEKLSNEEFNEELAEIEEERIEQERADKATLLNEDLVFYNTKDEYKQKAIESQIALKELENDALNDKKEVKSKEDPETELLKNQAEEKERFRAKELLNEKEFYDNLAIENKKGNLTEKILDEKKQEYEKKKNETEKAFRLTQLEQLKEFYQNQNQIDKAQEIQNEIIELQIKKDIEGPDLEADYLKSKEAAETEYQLDKLERERDFYENLNEIRETELLSEEEINNEEEEFKEAELERDRVHQETILAQEVEFYTNKLANQEKAVSAQIKLNTLELKQEKERNNKSKKEQKYHADFESAIKNKENQSKKFAANASMEIAEQLVAGEIKTLDDLENLAKQQLKNYLLNEGTMHAYKALSELAMGFSDLALGNPASAHFIAAAKHSATAGLFGVAAGAIDTSASTSDTNENNSSNYTSDDSDLEDKEAIADSTEEKQSVEVHLENDSIMYSMIENLDEYLSNGYNVTLIPKS